LVTLWESLGQTKSHPTHSPTPQLCVYVCLCVRTEASKAISSQRGQRVGNYSRECDCACMCGQRWGRERAEPKRESGEDDLSRRLATRTTHFYQSAKGRSALWSLRSEKHLTRQLLIRNQRDQVRRYAVMPAFVINENDMSTYDRL